MTEYDGKKRARPKTEEVWTLQHKLEQLLSDFINERAKVEPPVLDAGRTTGLRDNLPDGMRIHQG